MSRPYTLPKRRHRAYDEEGHHEAATYSRECERRVNKPVHEERIDGITRNRKNTESGA